MRVRELLTSERTHFQVQGVSKKRLLDQAAQMAAATCKDLSEQQIFDALVARERLGSTGIGEGIAIPHCRLPQCEQAFGVLLRLAEPIDFDAIDGKPVDLVFALLVPEEATEEHLQVLAMLARNFNEESYRSALRCAPDNRQLFQRAAAGT